MITPLDIQNHKFGKKLIGYNMDHVDSYLDLIIEDYSALQMENKEFKARINILQEQINKYKDLEENLKEAILIAQTTGEEVIKNAEIKADNIIKSAHLEREKVLKNTNDEVAKIKEEYEVLLKEVYIFKTRFESFLKSQLITIEDFVRDIE